jgi:hypothetical protein
MGTFHDGARAHGLAGAYVLLDEGAQNLGSAIFEHL